MNLFAPLFHGINMAGTRVYTREEMLNYAKFSMELLVQHIPNLTDEQSKIIKQLLEKSTIKDSQ